MAKIICITSGLTGITNASFELVKRLSSLGHELVYASPRPVKDFVESQGIHYVQLPEIKLSYDEDVPSYQGRLKKLKRWFYKFQNREDRKTRILEKLEPNAFVSLVKEEQPDLLIIDVELHEYIIKAHASNMPLVLLSQWFSLWRRPGLPYLLHNTIPRKNKQGTSLKINFDWEIVKFKRWWTFTRKKLFSVGTDRRTILIAYAKKLGFDLELIRENFWPGPFLYDKLPVLSMTASEMDFPHDCRPNYYNIGPMVYDKRRELRADLKTKKSIEKLIKTCKEEHKTLIYCSLSTLSDSDHAFIEKVVDAVAHHPEWILVLSTGKEMSLADRKIVRDNVYTFDFVPQLEVLAHSACSINHGGIHTINECIHHEVPMIVYSGKKSDQNGCAARVAYHNLGIVADKDIDSIEDVRRNIERLLSEEKYKDNVVEMNQTCKKYKEDSFVSQIINPLLREKKMLIA